MIVLSGQAVELPGSKTFARGEVLGVTDGARRWQNPIAVVLHTIHGRRGALRPGAGPPGVAERLARYQARTARKVSWHFTVGLDGAVLQSADPGPWSCWHAGHANAWSVGIEMCQEPKGDLYEATIAATVQLCEALAAAYAIPRRVPGPRVPVRRWQPVKEGGGEKRWPGFLGHRNLTREKGLGDPGDQVFDALVAAGFERITASESL